MATHAAARADAGLHAQTKTVLALLFSLSPVYFLVQTHLAWGLDKLHLGLIQLIFLLVLRGALKLDPRRLFAPSTKTQRPVSPPPSTTSSATLVDETDQAVGASTAVKEPTKRVRARRVAPASSNSLYPPAVLDGVVHQFIALVAPSLLSQLPTSTLSARPTTPLIALSSWTSLYATDALTVSQHPSLPALYAIEAHFPRVPLRALYETLSDMDRRGEWDGMCEGAEQLEQVEVGGRRANVIWMGMKGFGAFIKRKDMVLLSVVGRLPPIPPLEESEEGSRSPTPTSETSSTSRASIDFQRGTLRLFCATQSFDHPAKPPTSAYNRMQTSSGFVVEEDGAGGSRILQLTDLSGLGSWVPSAVLKMVTQTMIPKSLAKLAEAAAAWAEKVPRDEEDDSWLPPMLGEWGGAQDEVSPEGSESEDDEAEEPVPEQVEAPLSAAASKDLNALVSQLKSLTARLGALEASGRANGVGDGWGEALMKAVRKEGLAVGGATAMAIAAVVLYRRGRRAGR